MNAFHWLDYGVIVCYLIMLVTIGIFCSRNKNTSKDFILGGGKMPYFALGISCLMAALSAFSLVMVPGEIFSHGLSYWVLGLITPLFTLITCRVFMRFYFKLGSFTPFEYLEYRYNHWVRSMIAGATIYLRLIYLGMVLFSTSKVFEGAIGWPAWVSILLVGIISLVFTASGGLKAVVWTDVMQFVVLISGLFAILGFLFWKIDGGLFGAVTYAFEHGRGLQQFSNPDFYLLNPYVRLSFWLLLLGQFLAPIAMMASDQMTIQRLLASGSYTAAVKTQTVNALLTIPTMIILWVIGLSVFTFYSQHPELEVKSGDTALFSFISTLPTPFPGLIIAGMLAAVISTLNAVFNSMAVVYMKEFHQRYFNKGISELLQVRVTRIATVLIGVISIVLGLMISFSAGWLRQSVVEASTIFNILEAIIIPAFIFAVLSKRASILSVWVTAGMIWGLKLGMITWYALSTDATKDWSQGIPLGFGGPIAPTYGIFILICGVLIVLLWLWKRRMLIMLLATTLCGYGLGLIVWSFFSHHYASETAKALSFQWMGLPSIICYSILGVLWLTLGPVQKKEKYQGLTLFDQGELAEKRDK